MASNPLKIVINSAGKAHVVYECVLDYFDLLKILQNDYSEPGGIYIYWIDDDGDKIVINGEGTFNSFVKLTNKNQIYVDYNTDTNEMPTEEEGATALDYKMHQTKKPQKKRSFELTDFEKHENVLCNGCKMKPIIGIHYKCIVCPNFNLCMSCKHARIHNDHEMFKITSEIDNVMARRQFQLVNNIREGENILSDVAISQALQSVTRDISNDNPTEIFANFITMFSKLCEYLGDHVDLSDEITEASNLIKQLTPNQLQVNMDEDKNLITEDQGDQGDQGDQDQSEGAAAVVNNKVAVSEVFGKFDDMFMKIFDAIGLDGETLAERHRQLREMPLSRTDTTPEKKPKLVMDILGNFNELFSKVFTALGTRFNARAKTSGSSGKGQTNTAFDRTRTFFEMKALAEQLAEIQNNMSSTSMSQISSTCSDQSDSSTSEPADYSQMSSDLDDTADESKQEKSIARKAKIQSSLKLLLDMGFNDDCEWLTNLLETLDGDVNQAKDFLKPFNCNFN